MNKNFWSRLAHKCLQFAVVAVVSVILMLGGTHSAIALSSSNSSPDEGTAQLNQLQEESRQAVKSEPRDTEEVKQKAQRGPNEVQGDADLHGMNVPDNSQQARTVRQQAEDVLEKVTPGD